jgi:FkbM family methyltransferase
MSKYDFTDGFDDAMAACRAFEVAVDAGANKGAWTVPLAKRFKSVHAFEPVPEAYEKLWQAVEGLGNVTVYDYALLDAERDEQFTINHVGFAQRKPGVERNVTLKGKPLDSFGIGRVDFMKIDVDGSERDMILGAAGTIKQWSPAIFVEVKIMPDSVRAELLKLLGYKSIAKFRIDEIWVRE